MSTYRLTGDVDHGAKGPQERRASFRVGERHVTAPLLLHVWRTQTDAAEKVADRVAGVAYERREQDRGEVFDSGEGKGAEHPRNLAAQTATRHEDHTFTELRVLVGELHGDPAAEGLTDDGRMVYPEGDEQVSQRVGVCSQRVVLGRLVGVTVAGKVGSDDRVVLSQSRHDRPPGSRAAGHAVHEEQHGRVGGGVRATDAVDDLVPMEVDSTLFDWRHDREATAGNGRRRYGVEPCRSRQREFASSNRRRVRSKSRGRSS